jgi:hypothetical protein
MAAGIAALPKFVTMTAPVVTTSPAPSCAAANATNTVTVSTTVTVNTTLLHIFVSELQSTVTATGAMPIVQMTLVTSGDDFDASVLDLDAMYWYAVPADGSTPNLSDLHLVLSNGGSSNGGTVTQCISPTQPIGFAFSDEPGAHAGNYGATPYGGTFPNVYYYYSTMFPPSKQAYPAFPYDAALQIVAVNSDGTYPGPSVGFYSADDPYGYGIFPIDAEPFAPVAADGSVSCASLNGQMIHLYWNDMGGMIDNLNYTDGEITFGCSEGQALLPYLMH